MGKRSNKDLLVSCRAVCNPWEPCGSTEKVITVLFSSIKKLSRQSSKELHLSEEDRSQSCVSDPIGFL